MIAKLIIWSIWAAFGPRCPKMIPKLEIRATCGGRGSDPTETTPGVDIDPDERGVAHLHQLRVRGHGITLNGQAPELEGVLLPESLQM